MDTSPLPDPWPLDRPLPAELTGTGHGWFTRYRTWPVFSPQWARGRMRALVPLGLLLLVPIVATVVLAEPENRPLGAPVQLLFNLAWPLLAGPWLTSWVRRQGWPMRRETWSLIAAFAIVVAVQLGFNRFLAEPMKQAVAEAFGEVDESGQRRRAQLLIGLTVRSDPVQMEQAPAGSGEPPPRMPQALNLVAAAVATFFLAGGAGLRRRVKERDALASLARDRELARAQAERHEAELRLSVLAAQVEPHFLFNTLAGVRSAIVTDPARAAELVDRLVGYLRAAIPRLRNDGGAATTLASQVEIVRAYLALMHTRMPRLRYEIDIPEGLGDLHFPPLMLVSLAENAVKHGAEPKVGPVLIRLSAARDADGRLAVTVTDDGVGFGGATAGSGLGLANLKDRLQQLYRGRAELTLKARPEGGVAATIAIPAESEPA